MENMVNALTLSASQEPTPGNTLQRLPQTQTLPRPEFTCFPKLPKELRLKIWEVFGASADYRHIRINLRHVSGTRLHGIRALDTLQTDPILRTCSESREVGKKLYRVGFSGEKSDKNLDIWRPSTDMLWLPFCGLPVPSHDIEEVLPGGNQSSATFAPGRLTHAQHLALDLDEHLIYALEDIWSLTYEFEDLKTLTFVIKDFDRWDNGDEMKFYRPTKLPGWVNLKYFMSDTCTASTGIQLILNDILKYEAESAPERNLPKVTIVSVKFSQKSLREIQQPMFDQQDSGLPKLLGGRGC